MESLDVVVVGAVALLLAFQAWLTSRVWKMDSYDREQKLAQSKLIWFLPVAGPLLVFVAMRHVGAETTQRGR